MNFWLNITGGALAADAAFNLLCIIPPEAQEKIIIIKYPTNNLK
jgi:hypothetical protein